MYEYDKDIYRLDPARQRRVSFERILLNTTLPNVVIRMMSDRAGTLWLGGHEMLARWMNGKTTILRPTEGLPETRPRSFFQDSRGWVWVGLRYKGVSVTKDPDAESPQFVNYSTEQGLASNTIWSIAEDDMGRIYLGAGKGLDQLDPKTGRIRHFNTRDGLAGDDIGLPGMSGIEGAGLLRERYPAMPVLMLTVYNDDDRIFRAICAGARGYLLKKTPPARLLESLREVVGGGAPMSPEVARRVLELFQQFHPPDHVDYQLTPHELRLLKLLVEGHNYKTAAKEVGTTVHAVSFHMKNIYEKLEVHSKSEAVAKALRDRIVA